MSAKKLPREVARALEIELPKRVPAVKSAKYWERGEQYGKRRVYIEFSEENVLEELAEYCHKRVCGSALRWLRNEGKCWFELTSAKLEGLRTEKLSVLGKQQTENARDVLGEFRAEVEAACQDVISPWLEPTSPPKPESPEDRARRIEECF